MNCHEYREQVAVRLAEGTPPDDHGASCAECARYAELARAAWEAAGRDADEPVPPDVAAKILRTGRRPRGADLTLLRPGPLAAAAILVLGLPNHTVATPGPYYSHRQLAFVATFTAEARQSGVWH